MKNNISNSEDGVQHPLVGQYKQQQLEPPTLEEICLR